VADYTNDAQQRILRLVSLLAGHEITGIAPADIARQQGCAASMVTRDLDNLRSAGFAEAVPETGRWRLAPQVAQIAIKVLTGIDRAESRLLETRNRYTRGVGATPAELERAAARFTAT
jgi:DNA-binding IclR family transcriptional regulator